jgi:alkylation response protein AidB-like acyl-CoA dehydrogenase
MTSKGIHTSKEEAKVLGTVPGNVPATDPTGYDQFKDKWASIPTGASSWIQRAGDVAEVLAVDAVQRDRENKSPRAEIALLKHSGLLKVLGPKRYGGGEQPWSVGYKVIRKVAEADG